MAVALASGASHIQPWAVDMVLRRRDLAKSTLTGWGDCETAFKSVSPGHMSAKRRVEVIPATATLHPSGRVEGADNVQE
jgi:hypothetical protein